MKNILAIAVFILTLLLLTVNAQTKKKPLNYRAEFDSLSALKTKLSLEKKNLKKEIDSLTAYSEHLDTLIEQCRPIIFRRKYGAKIGSRIAMRQIWKGMTTGMLRDSWGKPDRITSKKYSYGRFTQYYYGKIIFFFKNGKLIAWEERKR